jgi:glycosyltransferase involved in cell wall biosynthesis
MNTPLRILQVYNEYRTWGGEDTVAYLEAEMLRRRGHEVEQLLVSTKEIDGAGPLRLVAAGMGTVWSFHGYSLMKRMIAKFSPDIVHVHNTFPMLSPSIFWAAHRAGVPAVQTIHNFRFACAGATLLRNEKPCQDCVGRFPWPALRHHCYQASLPATSAVVAMNVFHGLLRTFVNKVHAYIVLNEFSKEIMLRAGLPEGRVHVKSNFVMDPSRLPVPRRRQVVFAGAISRPKGVHLLLQAWAKVSPAGCNLILFGDGAARAELEREYAKVPGIEWRGAQSRQEVLDTLAASQWLVLPPLFYENCPMVIPEAFSVGTPVIVPNHGAFPAFVTHSRDGLLFAPGDADSLANTLGAALSASDDVWLRWSENARATHRRTFTEAHNYEQLISVYRHATQVCRAAEKKFRRTSRAGVAAPMADDLRDAAGRS